MKHNPLLLAIAFVLITNSLTAQVSDRDGNNYNSVKIGKQEWITSNLNVSHFRNGDVIPEIEDAKAWEQANNSWKPAWCYYKGDPSNGKTYGKLYNWYAVHDERGIAPEGWHIPTDDEWTDLTTYLGGENIAGGKMKATYGWSNNGNGTNASGFTALPGCWRNDDAGTLTGFGGWWSSTEDDFSTSWNRLLVPDVDEVHRGTVDDGVGLSVRCIKN